MNEARIVVREALENDLSPAEEVSELAFRELRSCYRPTPETIDFKKQIYHSLKRLVAIIDSRLIGTVEYRIETDFLHFLGLAVHPDCRLRGVARELINELETMARRHKIKRLTLDTVKETGNVGFFKRVGFLSVKEDEATQFVSDRFDRLTNVAMEKVLV